eukprot:711695-Amphidinium_carterae.3
MLHRLAGGCVQMRAKWVGTLRGRRCIPMPMSVCGAWKYFCHAERVWKRADELAHHHGASCAPAGLHGPSPSDKHKGPSKAVHNSEELKHGIDVVQWQFARRCKSRRTRAKQTLPT